MVQQILAFYAHTGWALAAALDVVVPDLFALADFIAQGFCGIEGEQLIAGFKLDRRQPGPGRVRVIADAVDLEQRTIPDRGFTRGYCSPGLYRQEDQIIFNENNFGTQ